MATRVEMWRDERGELHATEESAKRADLVAHIVDFLEDHGTEDGDLNSYSCAVALVDHCVLTPR